MHWKLNFFNGDPVLAIENSSKWPVRPYTNCTGQIWYDHWFPSWKVCFGPNSIAVQSWEVCALKIEFFQWRAYISYRELYFKVPCAAVHELYRSNLVCTLIPILKGVFWSEQHSCTVLGSMWTGIWIFSDCGFLHLISYRDFFKVTCAAVHELYRSNLVWPLIPILKGVFWSKQHSCTVLGSMCTENWIFSKEGLY